jgi:iron(III) transport system permease protein
MAPSLLTAVLIVFLDVMKELPGTLILRPFNFDTLAIAVYHLAADERIAELAAPALALVAAGLLPVALIMRAIAAGRPSAPVDGD